MPRRHTLTGDLFIRRMKVSRYPGAERFYGEYEIANEQWVVNCVNPWHPGRTALPLGLATPADARRALAALVGAGLGDTVAMNRRIKIERDWASVRRIMIEALNW